MNILTATNRKLLPASILIISFVLGLAIIQAQAAINDSSIILKKDPGTGLFVLTVRDPDGILEFLITPAGKLPYGGGMSGCKQSFSNNTVVFADPSDFTPVMTASVTDCKNNTVELEILPPVNGITKGIAVRKEEPPPPPPPPPPPKEIKTEGPLSAEDIQYPVSELGSCQNEAECRSYCDVVDNAKACFAFAKKYNLISEEEARKATDHFLNVTNGPGGCNSGKSCEEYCNTIDHVDACIAFADETGYYSPEQLAEARKFQALVKSGAQFPGSCTDRNSCELYCNDSTHMEECLNFAEETGFLPKEEIEQARKILPLMKSGETPGRCNSKEQCEKYCSADEHLDECIAFADKAGLLSDEEREMIKKTGGKGPGGCHSKVQCEAYCGTHSEECFNFAQEHGLMDERDLQRMREGMARFKQELDKMPPEAVQCLKDAAGEENFNKMLAGQPVFDRSLEGKMKSCFSQLTSQLSGQLNTLPPEAAQCIKNTIGEDGLEKLKSGEFHDDIDFSSLEVCFQQLQASFGGGPGGAGGPGGFSGPGGCTSIDECTSYCQTNPEECQGFGPPGGGGQGGFPGGPVRCGTEENPEECQQLEPPHRGGGGGPGGCTNPEECQAYCEEHPNECGASGGGGSGNIGGGFSGPGGCTSVNECTSYCQAHFEDQACQAYGGGGGGSGDDGSQSCVAPPSGLVGWWSADLASGTTVPDISGGNNGTISNGVTIVPMEVGSAFQFDGSSGHINMGNPGNLNFGTGPFSLEAWFNWNGGGGTSANNIIRKSNYGPGAGSGYWLRVGNGTLEFSVGATTGPDGQSIITAPVSTGVWHHTVGAKDGSGNIKLYVDGQSQGTVVRQASESNSSSEVPFLIGAWSLGGGVSEFFNGQIDEIAVYNRALSASEVQDLFNSGSVGKCSADFGRTNRELPQDYQQQDQQQYPQSQPSGNFVGPGGCTTPEECTAYCTQNYQDPACAQFAPPSLPSSSLSPSSLLGTVFGPWLTLLR